MAYYNVNEGLELGRELRNAMNHLRLGKMELEDLMRTVNQMSNAEISAAFGFDEANNHEIAAAAKAELAAGIEGELVANAALEQMLARFDG